MLGFFCLAVFCGWTIEFSHAERYFLEAWGPSTDSTNFKTFFFVFYLLLSICSEAVVMGECEEKCEALVDKLSEDPVRKHISDGQGE